MAIERGPVDAGLFAQLAQLAVRDDTYVLIHVGRATPVPADELGLGVPGSTVKLASCDVAIVNGHVVKARDPELLTSLLDEAP